MAEEIDVKVNGSYLLPLSLKRWIEERSRERSAATGKNVSAADIVREILEAARAESEPVELAAAS